MYAKKGFSLQGFVIIPKRRENKSLNGRFFAFKINFLLYKEFFGSVWEKNIKTGKSVLSDLQPEPPVFRL